MKRQRADSASTSPTSLPVPMQTLSGRVVLVAGAGSGIGRATAVMCAERGAKVAVADLLLPAALETQQLLSSANPATESEAIGVDVADEASVTAMINAVISRFGRLDCALNAAGIEGDRAPLHVSSVDNFDKVLAVNLRGAYLCMRAEIAQMLKQQAADQTVSSSASQAPIDMLNYSIVNVSSSAGQAGMPEFSAYSASKHGINGLTRSAAKEYASKGIRVNALCPSTTDTPMVARFAERWPEWQVLV